MKIIILGAGQVGGTLAETLVGNNDITIIDSDMNRLQQLQNKFDLRVIQGHASHPRILRQAGADEADMLVAVTNSDETNMVACQIAYSLFKVPTRIARIRSFGYLSEQDTLFNNDVIPVDHLIAPEQLVIDYISKLVEYPGVLQVVNLADNLVSLVVVKAYYGGPIIGDSIAAMKEHLPLIDVHIAAIFRHNTHIKPQPSTIIEAGDEIFFVVATEYIRAVMSEFQRLEKTYKQVMIVGGGNVGAGLAKKLEQKCNIKLIEHNSERAELLSELLQNTIVFCGDASDQQLLSEEHIEQIDLFIAVTNDDEANIMSAMLAKQLGARKAIVLIQRHAYINLVQVSAIDIAVSPQQPTISELLSHVHRADIVHVATLRRGVAEVIEAIAHGDENSSKVIGKTVDEIKLPSGATICAIVRDGDVMIANTTEVIKENDHIIIFLADRKSVGEIENIFTIPE